MRVETIWGTTVAILCEDGGLSQARKLSCSEEVPPTKPTATSGELAAREPPALTPQWLTRGWGPDAGCSSGCGSCDTPARPLWEYATHDGLRNGPSSPQSETTPAPPPRQTTPGNQAQMGVRHAWDRSPHSAPP